MGALKDKIVGTLATRGVGGAIGFTASAVLGGIVYFATKGAITLGQVFEGAVVTGAFCAALTPGESSKNNSDNEK